MQGFDPSQFAPSQQLLSGLGKFGGILGSQGFNPDTSAQQATMKSFQNAPMMTQGGGQLTPSTAFANPAGMTNPINAQAITQQAGQYDQNQAQLSDFLLQNGIDVNSIQAMLTSLKAMQMRSNMGAAGGVMGALF